MVFKIEKTMLDLGGGIYTGVVAAFGLDNASSHEKIEKLLKSEIAKAHEEFLNTDLKHYDQLDVYRQAMQEVGIKASKYPCSVEALLTRVAKHGELPFINPAVNLGNYISLKYRVPVGVHDIDTLAESELCVRLANEADCATSDKEKKDDLTVGEPVYVSGNSVRTRRWMWRQMPAGKVSESSVNLIFPIDGFTKNKDTIDKACAELAALLQEFFGIEPEVGRINRENNEFHFGPMSEEERDIENQIAIMLKGVANHTAVSEIRDKLITAKHENRPLRIKLGLDPSAPDIHLGHSVVLRKIRQLQDLGHHAVIIIGDFTGMIGDPTGKSATRKQLTRAQVEENANTYMEQIFKIIDSDRTEVHYNSEWLSKMTFADVIELSAKCTVARMLERDDFNNRYTNHLPLSIHEFFYPLMQAYDSVAIRADIELGGTDQTFNILMGRNIQRDYGMEPQLTLFMPLLEGIDGKDKMSKSLGNYIGINEPPAVIFEKVMKIPDSLIIKYYNLCTDVHPSQVAKLQHMLDTGTNPRDVKMLLAREITTLYTGAEAAAKAEERFKDVFQKNQVPDDAPVVSLALQAGLPHGEVLTSELVKNGYFKSKSEIRRIFQQGGASFDGQRILDLKELVMSKEEHVLKLGKNKFFRLCIQD